MTIKDVCKKYDIKADTLRYYEKVGVIPKISRNSSGVRDFNQSDLNWVENAICMRKAGVSIEFLIEYVKLYQKGNSTLSARKLVLEKAKVQLQDRIAADEEALKLLNYKIDCYFEAEKTGTLVWKKKSN